MPPNNQTRFSALAVENDGTFYRAIGSSVRSAEIIFLLDESWLADLAFN